MPDVNLQRPTCDCYLEQVVDRPGGVEAGSRGSFARKWDGKTIRERVDDLHEFVNARRRLKGYA